MHSDVGAQKLLFIHSSHNSLISANRIVKGVRFCSPSLQNLSLRDLERIKDTDKWLSDSLVTFSLMFVPFFFVLSPS
jgi:hypothetical protein